MSENDLQIQKTYELTEPSRFIKVSRVEFLDKGNQRYWDYTWSHDSVAIFIYVKDTKEIVFVKQFRPALLMHRLNNGIDVPDYRAEGQSIEMCAGIMDKNKSPEETAVEEVLEETGYKTSIDNLELIGQYRRIDSGAMASMYYTEVLKKDRISEGGGLASENEDIEVVHMSLEDAKTHFFTAKHPNVGGSARFHL